MKQFDTVVIGFGKGGKTMAGALAGAGQKVALVEQSDQMFGGTCINVACIPTKSLEHAARLSAAQGGDFAAKAARYRAAIEEKRRLTAMLRQKNYDKAAGAGVSVIVGTASFVDAHTISVKLADGGEERLNADKVLINTGARPFVPPIEGLVESRFARVSEAMMELEELPRRLFIVGGGYIGLEFASYYLNFGSEVTIAQDGETFIPREDAEVAAQVLESLEARGAKVLRGVKVAGVRDETGHAVVTVLRDGAPDEYPAEAVLIATGRRPNVGGLNLEAAGVQLTPRGAVQVDETLRTTADNIWAMGDVVGGLQFTYISLDDSRIVKSQLMGDGTRTTENRGAVPYSVFLDPPLSRVGMTEDEAKKQGHAIKVARLPAAAIPKAQVLRQPTGFLKAIVDADTGLILGAHLFCAESHEMINLIKLAMDAKLPYTVLRDAIYTHPTMSEALNDLFAALS